MTKDSEKAAAFGGGVLQALDAGQGFGLQVLLCEIEALMAVMPGAERHRAGSDELANSDAAFDNMPV